MQDVLVQESAGDRRGRCDNLPLGLGREPRSCPASECVRFVIADVANGLGLSYRTRSPERVVLPATVTRVPVERCLPALVLASGPTVGQPELGSFVRAVGDELDPLTASDRPSVQTERLEVDSGPWQLVIEDETTSLESELAQSTIMFDPCARNRGRSLLRSGNPVGRLRKILGKHMLDVHEQELLVLLLMIETELDEPRDIRIPGGVRNE